MGILQKTEDKVERFSLEVANQEMEKLRTRMDNLRVDIDGKLDMEQYHNLQGRLSDLNDKLNALIRKFDHDRDCMTHALENISQILLGMFARGANVSTAERDHLLALQAEVNELQTHNKYWYGEFTNRAGYY